MIAVVNLDAVAGSGLPRLELAGDTARSPSASLVETVRAAARAADRREPGRPSALRQLVDLGLPVQPVRAGAVRLPRRPGGDRSPPAPTGPGIGDRTRLNAARLGQVGRATQNVVDALEQGIALAPGPSSYVYLGSRIVRGWAIEIVLVAMLLPFLVSDRRPVRALPATAHRGRSRPPELPQPARLLGLDGRRLRAVRGRSGSGRTGSGGRRRSPGSRGRWAASSGSESSPGSAGSSPATGSCPAGAILPEEQLAGHTAALLALGVVALLVVATNPFALVFLLPSLHAWLWLPQVRGRAFALRAAVLLVGFAGPALLLWSFASRYGLGLDAPWYIAWLYALGYAPSPGFLVGLAWAAAAAQLVALSVGRYAPYPAASERPPRGPLRETVRRLVLAQRRRHLAHAPVEAERALHG